MLPGAAGRGCCHLTLRVLKETSSGSTKFKLLSLLLAQPQRRGGKDDWQPPGIKVVAAPTLGEQVQNFSKTPRRFRSRAPNAAPSPMPKATDPRSFTRSQSFDLLSSTRARAPRRCAARPPCLPTSCCP